MIPTKNFEKSSENLIPIEDLHKRSRILTTIKPPPKNIQNFWSQTSTHHSEIQISTRNSKRQSEVLIPTKDSKTESVQKFWSPQRTPKRQVRNSYPQKELKKKTFSIQRVWFSQTTPKNVQKFLLFSINNSWNLQASSGPIKNSLKHYKILIPQTEFQNVPFRNVKSPQRTPKDKQNIWSPLSTFKLKTCRYFDPHKELTNWRQSEIVTPRKNSKLILTFRNSNAYKLNSKNVQKFWSPQRAPKDVQKFWSP